MQYRSPKNPAIKEALLLRDKPDKGLFFIEGAHLVESAARSGAGLSKVFFTGSFAASKEGGRLLGEVSSQAAKGKSEPKLLEVSERIFQGLADTETPQGIAAIVSCPRTQSSDLVYGPATFMVVCDGVRDPGNLGTIIRLADAAGADAVVITPGTCSPFNQKAIRSTAGSLFNIPLLFTPPEELAATLRKNKVSLYIADSHATVSVFETDFRGPFALVFGNEGMGTGESMKSNADRSIRIPLRGRAESLNVAAAAAICIYEAVRQRIS